MPQPSITSSPSFTLRAQRSEATRALLWLVVLAGMLLLTLVRRAAGGAVMSDDDVFYPYAGLLALAALAQLPLLSALRRANRDARVLPDWLWRTSALLDLAVVAGLLAIAAFLSPRGAVPALTAPPLLLMPLLVLLSVLRLRPNFTLYAGLAGAAVHAALAARALLVTDAPYNAYPVYFAYGFVLALTAFAGAFVARELRTHVREAADEAAAHEHADRQLFGLHRDLSVARDIQRGLLPNGPPRLPGFDITGMNRPADQTGGDYYDWQPLPDGKLAVVLADVSGHGIGPALVMAVCRAYARASAPTAPDPATLLSHINQLLHADLRGDRFITFALVILDPTGHAQLVSAGHGPTLLYRAATGQLAEFGGDGIPLGIDPLEQYGPTTSINLDQGDVLVLLTDGFFEWTRPTDDEPFGIARLRDALRQSAPGDAPAILRSIDHAVSSFCHGTPQSDDMTAIVIKRTAPTTHPAAPNHTLTPTTTPLPIPTSTSTSAPTPATAT